MKRSSVEGVETLSFSVEGIKDPLNAACITRGNSFVATLAYEKLFCVCGSS